MDFLPLVESLSARYQMDWGSVAVILATLLSQYPGGVTDNILNSHFQIKKQESTIIVDGEFTATVLEKYNWSLSSANAPKSTKMERLAIYEGRLEVSQTSESIRSESIKLITNTKSTSSYPVEVYYYIPEAWQGNLEFFLPHLFAKTQSS